MQGCTENGESWAGRSFGSGLVFRPHLRLSFNSCVIFIFLFVYSLIDFFFYVYSFIGLLLLLLRRTRVLSGRFSNAFPVVTKLLTRVLMLQTLELIGRIPACRSGLPVHRRLKVTLWIARVGE